AADLGPFSAAGSAQAVLVLTRTLIVTAAAATAITVVALLTLPPAAPLHQAPSRSQPSPSLVLGEPVSLTVNVPPSALLDSATSSAATARLVSQLNHELANRDLKGRDAGFMLAFASGPLDGISQAIVTARSAIRVVRAHVPGFSRVSGLGYWNGAGNNLEFKV